jgi:hypothetical protein
VLKKIARRPLAAARIKRSRGKKILSRRLETPCLQRNCVELSFAAHGKKKVGAQLYAA